MKKVRLIALIGFGVAVLVASASGPPAFAHDGDSTSAGQSTYTVSQQRVKLSPIVVEGQHLVVPLFLQLVKTALHRPWSSSQADQNKLVCRFQTMMGSHMQTLRCMTNGQYFKQYQATQLALNIASAEPGSNPIFNALITGQIPVSIANYATQHRVNRGALMKLLKKLPPRGSSYTLRITDYGKSVVDYVIKNGKLKAIRHYHYNKQGMN